MATKINRRKALAAGAASAGLFVGACAQQSPEVVVQKTPECPLDDVWGEEFLMQHQEPAPRIDVTLTYRPVGDEDLLVWSVHFSILFGPSLLLHIQPVTGETLEVKSG